MKKSFFIIFSFVLVNMISLIFLGIIHLTTYSFQQFPKKTLLLPRISKETEGLYPERNKALALQIYKTQTNDILIGTQDGPSFNWPSEKQKFSEFLQKKAHSLEAMAVLAMAVPSWIGVVQVYADKDIEFSLVNEILEPAVEAGFDEVDIAFTVGNHET